MRPPLNGSRRHLSPKMQLARLLRAAFKVGAGGFPCQTGERFAEQLAVACAAAGLPNVYCWDMAVCDHEAMLSPPTSSSSCINASHDSSNKREAGSFSSSGGQHQRQQHQQQKEQQGEGGALAPGTAVLVVVSTYEGGSPPENAKWFCRGLEENSSDFRVGKAALSHLYGCAVFGCGNSLYKELGNFNACALRVDAALSALGAPRLGRVALGDEDNGSMDTAFKAWTSARITKLLRSLHGEDGRSKGQQQQQQQQGGAASSSEGDEEEDAEAEEEEDEMSEGGGSGAGSGGEVDMEDMAGSTSPAASNASLPQPHGVGAGQHNQNRKKSRPPGASAAPAGQSNQQQTDVQRANLTKQGYKLIGSHSGVKMCRNMEATGA